MRSIHKHQRASFWGRTKLVGAGLALTGVGTALIVRDVQMVRHWTGQPLFSWGLVAAGGLCIVLAIVPESWITKAADIEGKKGRHSL